MEKKRIKRDIILAVFLLLLCGAALLIRHVTAEKGEFAQVTVDGREIARYPLSEDREVTVEGIGGENKLVISNGKADVCEADCPDKVCVDHRSISNVGETIVCLPHKVVVKIVGADGGEDSGVDMGA